MAVTYYEDYVWDNNDKVSAETVMYNEGVYGFPLSINIGYFMHYDSSIITDPTSLEKIVSKCDRKFMVFCSHCKNNYGCVSYKHTNL